MTLFKAKISFSDRFKHKQAPSEAAQFGRDARTDWQMACISFLVLTFVAITVSIVAYERTNRVEVFQEEKKEPVSLHSLDRFELERTVLFYEKKHERFEALKRRPLPTVDPFISDVEREK